ncbi:MAG: beta-propeller fold lactonase family protein [Bacteroidota bacterium]
MRERFLVPAIIFFLLGFYYSTPIQAQLYYEQMIFDGQGQPQLSNPSSVAVSPDDQHVYATSNTGNAINIYSRNQQTGNLDFVNAITNGQQGVSGLNSAYAVVVSPDGNHVYVVANESDAIVAFSRNVSTGDLTFVASYFDNIDGVDGIDGAVSIQLSPDGNHVYVAGPDDSALAIFSRNVLDGTLDHIGMQKNMVNGLDKMSYPSHCTVSPDGQFVYVTSYDDLSIVCFERNANTGMLTMRSVAIEGENGVTGLFGGPNHVHISEDGKNAYCAGVDLGTLVVFSRDEQTGALSYLEMHSDDMLGVDGIGGAISIMSSSDGNQVYVLGAYDEAIAVFDRNTSLGTLSFNSQLRNGIDADGLSNPVSMMMSKDDQNIYAAGYFGDALVVFDRNDNTGNLAFKYKEVADADGVDGLGGANAVSISPDGKHVYVTGNGDNGMAVFSRNEVSGGLDYLEVHKDGLSGVDGMKGVNWVYVSPDGKNVYTTGFWDHSISVFSRDETSGELTFMEFEKDNNNGVDGLNGANGIVVSPDGKNLYSSAFWEHSLAVFDRNADGSIEYVTRFKDGTGGVDGLSRATAVAIDPDGKNVYVSSSFDNAVAMFSRDETTGALTYMGLMKDGVGGVDGLRGASSLAVSPDGKQLIATGPTDNGFAVFDRNTTDGTLTFTTFIQNGVDDIGGLERVSRVVYSPFGSHVYTTSPIEHATVVFNRNVNDNELTFEKMQINNVDGVSGIDGAGGLAISNSGRHIYVSGTNSNAVTTFSCTYLLEMNEMICEGDSVMVGLSAYKTSGTFRDTFGFGGSCQTVVALDLEVQAKNYTQYAAICQGDSYEFNGMTYTTAGSFDANMSSSMGCDSIVTLVLEVASFFNNEVEEVAICQGEVYEFGTDMLTEAGSYTKTFTAVGGCDSTVTLNLNLLERNDIQMVEYICEGDFFVFGTNNYINPGVYTQSLINSKGCDSLITLDLRVLTTDEPNTIEESICAGEVFNFGNNTYNLPGSYPTTYTTNSGCQVDVTLNLSAKSAPKIELTEYICDGDTYTFEGNVLTDAGTYVEVYAASSGCDSTITLNLVVNPSGAEEEVTTTICEGESYELGGIIHSTTGVYEAIMTPQNGCGDSVVTLNLTVEPATDMIDAMICEGEVYTIESTTYDLTGTYTQMIQNASGCETEITLNLMVNARVEDNIDARICAGEVYVVGGQGYTQSGTYTTKLQTSVGCDSVVFLELVVTDPINVISSITNNSGRNDGAIDISVFGGTQPYSFSWSNGKESEDIENLSPGKYSVTITDADGCWMTESFEVSFSTNTTFVDGIDFRASLSPNLISRGAISQLLIESDEVQQMEIRVLNANGQLLEERQLTNQVGSQTYEITAPLVPGMYFVVMINNKGQYHSLPMIVQ